MLAVIGAINGVAPVTAPIVGGALTDVIGWRGIFCILLALGCVLLISCLRFRESLPATRRSSAGWGQLLHGFGAVLHNRPFVGYILQLGFAQGILFGNIASSPFIVQEHYGFSAFGFSLCFAANSLAIMSAAALAVRFRRQERATLLGCRGMLLFSLATAAALACHCGFWLYEVLVFALLFSMGITFPATTTLAMDCTREHAGTASALLGAVCFAFGGLVSPLVGMGDTLLSTGTVFVVCAVGSWLAFRSALHHRNRLAVA